MAAVNLAVTLDGEILAYCAMKSALEEILELRDKPTWDSDLDRAAAIAKAALECEEQLSGT